MFDGLLTPGNDIRVELKFQYVTAERMFYQDIYDVHDNQLSAKMYMDNDVLVLKIY
jgi:hypothetical protein